MNKIGQVTEPEVVEAISQVRDTSLGRGIRLGIFGATPTAVTPYIREGYSLIAVGVDTMILGNGAKEIFSALQI